MKAKAWRLYGASDLRLEDVELAAAGADGVVVEIVANSVCVSDYKCVTLGAGHKRVPGDIAVHPVMVGHEMSGIVREVGEKWKDRFLVGQIHAALFAGIGGGGPRLLRPLRRRPCDPGRGDGRRAQRAGCGGAHQGAEPRDEGPHRHLHAGGVLPRPCPGDRRGQLLV